MFIGCVTKIEVDRYWILISPFKGIGINFFSDGFFRYWMAEVYLSSSINFENKDIVGGRPAQERFHPFLTLHDLPYLKKNYR